MCGFNIFPQFRILKSGSNATIGAFRTVYRGNKKALKTRAHQLLKFINELTEEIYKSQNVEHESSKDEEVPYHVGELKSSL